MSTLPKHAKIIKIGLHLIDRPRPEMIKVWGWKHSICLKRDLVENEVLKTYIRAIQCDFN